MYKLVTLLLTILVFQGAANAADKIRIAIEVLPGDVTDLSILSEAQRELPIK